MAKAKDDNAEGKAVRRAYDGPDISHDALIAKILELNSEDHGRASSAGETRAKVGEFTERTGMNPKAFAVSRMILKQAAKDGGQAKAMDVIRSLEKALPMLRDHVAGQQSEMNLDADAADKPGDGT